MAVGIAAGQAHADERVWDASVAATWTDYSQFDDTSVGLGLSLSRRLSDLFAVEAQLGYSPSDLGELPFSGSRFEGYVGLRGGPHLGRHQVFAAVRPGFVRFSEAPAPIACIAIYPPPLVCSLAAGETLFAVQLGGGFELVPSERSLVRLEAGSQLVRYPGPAIARDQGVFDDALWSHNLRLGVSVGLRF